MTNLEKEHYKWLRTHYTYLIRNIMGSDYYTTSIHVFDADVEAFKDMEYKIDNMKYELKMWKRLAMAMILISCILVIFK